ncbi:MAG: hypothetical protein Kow0080_14580 [Candidatus Promineifilaceae bacterium]
MNFPRLAELPPFVTTAQMVEVDRLMIEVFRIELVQMMENAGRNLARLANGRFLQHNPLNKQIVVLAGTGGNGGGALVAARHLHNMGAQVHVVITKPASQFTAVPAHQLDILQRIGLPIHHAAQWDDTAVSPHLILDGIIGYSLKGAPHGTAAALIHWTQSQSAPILSLDTPSGIDTTTGHAFTPAIRATATMTLALPKEGLRSPNVIAYIGELYLANISVPPELYTAPTLQLTVAPLFTQSDIVRLW